jgi:hypothetical protein
VEKGMGIEEDIKSLFKEVLVKHGGNKAAAARSLDTNSVTFWGWVTAERKPPAALCRAIDKAGAKLVWTGEDVFTLSAKDQEIKKLQEKIESLSRENDLLNKLVRKYEADEHEKNEPSTIKETYQPESISSDETRTRIET